MLKKAAIVAAILIAGVLYLAALQPTSFHLARSISIRAPAEEIFPLINSHHAFSTWSPFEKDPAMKRSFSGPASGPGAVYEFSGNSEVGSGRVTITAATPPTSVTMSLVMTAPMAASNVVEFTLVPDGDSTTVTWTMQGPSSLVARLLGVFIDMDGMVGREFETGLASLKAIAEK